MALMTTDNGSFIAAVHRRQQNPEDRKNVLYVLKNRGIRSLLSAVRSSEQDAATDNDADNGQSMQR